MRKIISKLPRGLSFVAMLFLKLFIAISKQLHRHAARKPHGYLMKKSERYHKWHNWDNHKRVHYSILITYCTAVATILTLSYGRVLAVSDLFDTWNFSSQSDYTLDQEVEFNGNSVRLKPQEYASDGNTAALFHFNETSGSSFADSSPNSNTGSTFASPSWATGNMKNSLSLNGVDQYGSVPDSPSLSLGPQQTVEGWFKTNNVFNTDSTENQTIIDKGSYKMQLDRASGKLSYEIDSGDTQWTKRLGDDLNGSWSFGHYTIYSMVTYGTDIIVGTGPLRGDGEVWWYNGSTWTKIGGDGIRSGWIDQTYETVSSLAVNGTTLYAGLGNSAGDAEVWTCNLAINCMSWTKIAGDGIGGVTSSIQSISSMEIHGGSLYIGTGSSGAGYGDVFKYNGGVSWTQIGGDGLPGSWAAATYEDVSKLHSDGTHLYAGLGMTANDAEVWQYSGSGTTWTKIGGDSVNNSWGAGYEAVRSFTSFGGDLYAGIGDSGLDAEVWKFDGSTWTKIGGDGIAGSWNSANISRTTALANDGTNLYASNGSNTAAGDIYRYNGSSWTKIGGGANLNGSWSGNPYTFTSDLIYANSKLYATPSGSSVGSRVWEYNGSNWTPLGGNFQNNSWGGGTVMRIKSSTTMGDKVYFGLGGGIDAAQVYEYDGTTARRIGGSGTNDSWPTDTYQLVDSLVAYKGKLYAGLGGGSAGMAEVWAWDGSTWTKMAGDGVNSTWNGGETTVESMAVFKGKLYAGLGFNSAYTADIWEYDGSSWTQVAGEPGSNTGQTKNGSWNTNPRGIDSMTVYKNQLCAGVAGNSHPEVWCWSGSGNWVKIGGGNGVGINNSWVLGQSSYINSMIVYRGMLYAGVSTTNGHVSGVWVWDGSTWTQVGGDDLNNSWSNGTYSFIKSMAVYNGQLYIGTGFTGSSNPTGDIWKYDGSSWTQTGGDGLNNSWTTAELREEVSTLTTYKGKLYAGLGFSANSDPFVYSYGNNGYIESNIDSFSNSWHHIAATYDGITAKIYVDGALDSSKNIAISPADNSLPLLFGASYGGPRDSTGSFSGQLDEFRISNVARTSFISKPYSTTAQTVTLNNAVHKSGIQQWDNWSANEAPDGGVITYRLSGDDGTTWKYWDGSTWTTSSNISQANDVSTINTNINSFAVGFGGIKWQAVLAGNGEQRVQLNSTTLSSTSDVIMPNTNASSISASKSNGGSSLANNAWTNGPLPYFNWAAGTDNESGILGYCLYLGQTPSADPETTKGLLGNSPIDTDGACQFVIGSTSIDLASPGYLGTALTTSNTPYYLNIRAIDRAGNVFGSSAQFQFRFDDTPPSNPGFISGPANFINTKTATFTWPTSGGQAASDPNSGVAGLQYKIGNTLWYGDSHTGLGDNNDLLVNDGDYTTIDPPDFDNITDGINTIYFRTWDQAGNVTMSYISAALKVNTSGAPSEPLNLAAIPTTNTVNSFTFSWDPPATFNTTTGQPDKLDYCYTINTLPSVSSCAYTARGITTAGPSSFATQPGVNTFYVVARDDFNAINYASLASTTFTANTTAPGIPLNADIVDVSIKATNNWRLAITWDQPSSVGSGIASYRVYRSLAPSGTYSLVGSSSSTTYIDAGLAQQIYYYKIRACDNTNNCGADSTMVSMLPTGKFTSPATMTSEPEISNLTTKKSTIKWSTDRNSDSKIALGTSSGSYSPSEIGNSTQTTSHTIDLDNLAAGTTYYYIAKWTDEDGNTGSSQEYTFKTAPAPSLKEVNAERVGLSSSIIKFTSEDAYRVDISYGATQSFGGITTINTSPNESTYSAAIDGLSDGTKYLFKLTTYDKEGNKYDSSIYSFTTPARPKISNLRFQPIAGEPTSTQQVTWNTNVPTTSAVIYSRINGDSKNTQSLEMKTEHSIIIRDLQDDSEYSLVAESRDTSGNLTSSDRQLFRTALDTRPPKVFDVSIESTIRGVGGEARGQVIVSWRTDEPATSQVGYAEGSNATVFNSKTAEDSNLSIEHVVIVSDLPTSRVYSVQPISRDKSNNEGLGEAQSAIIGRASDDVLTIVFNTLRRVFGY